MPNLETSKTITRLRRWRQRRGIELVLVIVMVTLLSAIGLATLTIINTESIQSRRLTRQEQILNIAEAGANYYRWRLAHYPNDFQDGTGHAGPYIHDFQDATGTVIGRYELTITPPVIGSTITTVKSVGYLLSAVSTKKTITVRLGIPSLTKYAVLGNSDLRFGEGTETFGPVHSNGGIRFDGLAHGLVSSAKLTYDDPDHSGANEIGVHTHVNVPPATGVSSTWRSAESDPNNIPNRSDVFAGSRQINVAPIDFLGITADLTGMKTKAQNNGFYLGSSSAQGYHVVLKTTGRMDITVVNTQLRCQYHSGNGTCSNNASRSCSGYNTGCSGGGICQNLKDYRNCAADYTRMCSDDSSCRTCTGHPNGATIYCSNNSDCSPSAGTCNPVVAGSCEQTSYSIGTSSGSESPAMYNGLPATNIPFPSNGIIFLGDNVWVDGTIDGARLSIVAAEDPINSGTSSIYINKSLRYTHTDGTDSIGLIAENNILVGYFSQNNLEIDGALIAQKGRVGRPYYGSGFIYSTNANYFQLAPAGSTLPNGGLGETSCNQFQNRSSLTTNGSLATYQRYGFAWTGGSNPYNCAVGDDNDSGYCDRNLTFDPNLTYGPPPSFPTTGQYQVISFDEQ